MTISDGCAGFKALGISHHTEFLFCRTDAG